MVNRNGGNNHIPIDMNIDNDDTQEDRKSAGTKIRDSNASGTGKAGSEDELELLRLSLRNNGKGWTHGLKGAFLSLLYFLFTSFILVFFMNFVHMRMPLNSPPLPDLGHELIPRLEPEKLGDMSMGVLIVTFLIAMILNRNRWPILINFCLTMGNLYLLRVISVLSTSMPPTENHCRYNYQKIENIYWNTIMGIVTLGSSNIHCGDLMFSGHTCMVTNIWMAFQLNYKKNWIIRIFTSLVLIVTFVLIIGTRSHYTVDIWIAFWLTVFVHKLTPYTFPFTKKKISNYLKNL
jgi:hypothetical protein